MPEDEAREMAVSMGNAGKRAAAEQLASNCLCKQEENLQREVLCFDMTRWMYLANV
jgi:hypothetical protein